MAPKKIKKAVYDCEPIRKWKAEEFFRLVDAGVIKSKLDRGCTPTTYVSFTMGQQNYN